MGEVIASGRYLFGGLRVPPASMMMDMPNRFSDLVGMLTAGVLALGAPVVAQASDNFADYRTEPAKAVPPAGPSVPPTPSAPPTSRADRDALGDAFGGYKSETRPCKDSTMQFSFPTEVRQVLVRAGQAVKQGEVLARARDAELKAAVDQQRLISSSTLDVENRQKQMDLAQFRFDRLKAGRNYSPMEFEEARIALEVARVQ